MSETHVYEVTEAAFYGGVLRTPEGRHNMVYRSARFEAGKKPAFLKYLGVKSESEREVIKEMVVKPPKAGDIGELAEGEKLNDSADDQSADDADKTDDEKDGPTDTAGDQADSDADDQGDTLSQTNQSKIDDLDDLSRDELLVIANAEPLNLEMRGNAAANTVREAIRVKRAELDL